ncbi:TIR domain-containing protein [Plantactinospora sp. WMMB334]|uniref:TIR domain-containing protein n=1 Tax=Plantactinospora sp. WMMB334 TaxID=3404119 RepID=UPI003B93A51B
MAKQSNRIGRMNADAVTFGERSPIQASGSAPAPARPCRAGKAGKGGRVFVIHGRDLVARDALFGYLRALGLEPLEWERLVRDTRSATPSLKEVVDRAARDASAVIALLTPDDLVELHPALRRATDSADEHGSCQARPNVFLELGMALALHPDRTIILEVGRMRRPTDLGGLNYVHMDAAGNWLNKVASRLEGAGCPVDRTGDDWRSLKRFDTLAAHERKPH